MIFYRESGFAFGFFLERGYVAAWDRRDFAASVAHDVMVVRAVFDPVKHFVSAYEIPVRFIALDHGVDVAVYGGLRHFSRKLGIYIVHGLRDWGTLQYRKDKIFLSCLARRHY
jgi:hypothetical protein